VPLFQAGSAIDDMQEGTNFDTHLEGAESGQACNISIRQPHIREIIANKEPKEQIPLPGDRAVLRLSGYRPAIQGHLGVPSSRTRMNDLQASGAAAPSRSTESDAGCIRSAGQVEHRMRCNTEGCCVHVWAPAESRTWRRGASIPTSQRLLRC